MDAPRDAVGLHQHCERCVKLSRCAQAAAAPGERCPLTYCPAGCGHRLHTCKLSEHQLLCPETRVPCINSEYGCPVILPRRRRAAHLVSCPASVVLCMAEWNRWPRSRPDTGASEPDTGAGEPDSGAAEPDTGAVGPDSGAGEPDSGAGEDGGAQPNGVEGDGRQNWSEFVDGRGQWEEIEQRNRSDVSKSEPASAVKESDQNGKAAVELGSAHSLSALRKDSSVVGNAEERDYLQIPIDEALTLRDERQLQACLVGGAALPASLRGRQPPAVPLRLPGTFDCSHLAPELALDRDAIDEPAAHPPGLQRSMCSQLARTESSGATSSSAYGNYKFAHVPPDATLDLYHNSDCVHKISKDLCKFCRNMPEPARTKVRVTWQPTLVSCQTGHELRWRRVARSEPIRERPGRYDLDAVLLRMKQQKIEEQEEERRARELEAAAPPRLSRTIEAISRHQKLPRTLYRFQCARLLRRDEFADHYQQVHGDVHGGAESWLHQRCPLAQYGCSHVVDRLYPDQSDQRFVVSPVLGSVGVTSCGGSSALATPPDGDGEGLLTKLPFEVLQHIAALLDPFSLNHLSLTCRLLRDVCSSLLESRGLVLIQWAPLVADGTIVSWRTVGQSWRFSHAFAPVRRLRFHEGAQVSDHLAQCQHGRRQRASQPFKLLPSRALQSVAEQLQRRMQLSRASLEAPAGPRRPN